MFDAKSLLDAIFNAAAPPASQQRTGQPAGSQTPESPGGQSGGLEDLLRNLTGGSDSGDGSSYSDATSHPSSKQSGGLEDLLRNLTGGSDSGGGNKNFSDILGKLQGASGGVAEALRQALGQATQGTKEGAAKIGDAVGARDIIGKLSGGRSPEELLAQLKKLMADNQIAAGTALGGLGALILGTGAGRSIAVSAAKLGALALIGGYAYKAYQNYKQGQQPTTGAASLALPAPEGSGFEPSAISNESAALYLRSMIAAAAADGRIDAAERTNILDGLGQTGVDASTRQFLERELQNPATVDAIASEVGSPEEAARVYTAARIAIEPDTQAERVFLARLADSLGIDRALAAHIDATARKAAA